MPQSRHPWIVLLLGAALWGGTAPAWAQDAQTLIRQGRVLDAVPVAENEALAHPADLDAWERWIDLSLALGMTERMVPTIQTRVQRHPEDPDAHYLLGRALPDPADSRVAYERALRLDPDHARAWMGVGALERATGELRAAAEAYQRALRTDPTLAEAWGGLMTVFSALGDRDALAGVADAARRAVPDDPAAYLTLAALRPAQAGALLREAAQNAGWDGRVMAALAEQLLREDDAAAAVQAATRAVAIDPRNGGARFALLLAQERVAGTLSAEGMAGLIRARTLPGVEAGPLLDRLIASNPRSPMLHVARAAARPPEQAAQAEQDLARALELDPGHHEARATLGLRLVTSRPERAVDLLAPVAAARPEDPDLATAIARARLASGRAQEALLPVQAAAERHPYDVELQLTHIQVLHAASEGEAALQAARGLAQRVPEVRTLLVWAAAAVEAGALHEAARVYRRLQKQTNETRFGALAAELEAKAAGG